MTGKDFDKIRDELLKHCIILLSSKEKDYATQDRLHNFKLSATRQQTTPELALWYYRDKHETAIQTAIHELAKNGKKHPLKKWREWVGDSINYLILLYALIAEREKANAKASHK